jgi:Papain family cysteine protease
MPGNQALSEMSVDYESKFNTILWNKLADNQRRKIGSSIYHVSAQMVKYPVLPPYPRVYDPRNPAKMPAAEYKNWFFKDDDNKIVSVITEPLDQGKCGSDWAFATASMFTDTVRHALMTVFGDKACFYSKMFDPLRTCTGDTGVELLVQGIEHASTQQDCKNDNECNSGTCLDSGKCLGLVSLELRNRISAYYTIGFAPKLKPDCKKNDTLSDCLIDCSEIYAEWKNALTTNTALPKITAQSRDEHIICSGCEGNSIIMPLYMFVESGAPLLSDFPVQEWGCIFGSELMRSTFCSEEFLKASVTSPFPELIQADRYGHFTQDDVRNQMPDGINNMEEWIMAEILNNASVTVGFNIYPCFFQFFLNNPEGVFSFKFLQSAIAQGNQDVAGGHSVDIIGWNEEVVNGELIQYWIARNSWGEQWGDKGFFKFERGLDQKLHNAKLDKYATQFENEFGTLYYAPFPNPNLYTSDDYTNVEIGGNIIQLSKRLSKTVRLPPIAQCESIRLANQANAKLLKRCECSAGYVKNTEDICVRDLGGNYRIERSGSSSFMWLWLIIPIILIAGGFIIWKARSANR